MNVHTIANDNRDGPPIVAYEKFLAELGRTPTTGWRWRRNGWLRTTNISGRLYLTADAITDFTRRATDGEFSQKHPTPQRKAAP
jgi:hypothetical protein